MIKCTSPSQVLWKQRPREDDGETSLIPLVREAQAEEEKAEAVVLHRGGGT